MTVLLQTGLATAWLCGCLLLGSVAQAQQLAPLTGQVTDAATGQPLPYASVGVLGRPAGTVADEQGRFRLPVLSQYDADSLRIALVGYRPYTTTVQAFRQRTCPPETGCAVSLTAAPQTALREVVVRAGKAVRRVLGNSSNSKHQFLEFNSNDLGNQVGLVLRIRRPTLLEEVSFHVAQCTYDSLFYRINIYRIKPDGLPNEEESVLPAAVYVRLTKAQTTDRIRVDLRSHALWLEPDHDVAVCLELVRDLGPGKLYFTATLLGGPLLVKEGGVGSPWQKVGVVGPGIDATVTEYR